MRLISLSILLGAVLALTPTAPGHANAAVPAFEITIKDHRFSPATIEVPAGQKISLLIHNADPTPEEFESYELNREKVVPGNGDITVYVGPLDPGTYPFFGDFNQTTAQGKLIAK